MKDKSENNLNSVEGSSIECYAEQINEDRRRRKRPTESTIKALFAKSGNQCSFPKCNHALIDDKNLVIGELCHINAVNKKDARFDPSLSDNELREYDNLILLLLAMQKIGDVFSSILPRSP